MTKNEKIAWGIAAALAGGYALYRYDQSTMTGPAGSLATQPPWLTGPQPSPPGAPPAQPPSPAASPWSTPPLPSSATPDYLYYAPISPLESHVSLIPGDVVRVDASSNAPELAAPGALSTAIWGALQDQISPAVGLASFLALGEGTFVAPGRRTLYFQLRAPFNATARLTITRVLSSLGVANGTITGVSRALPPDGSARST